MGGGSHPPHPKWVWSPAGGWQWQDVWAPVSYICATRPVRVVPGLGFSQLPFHPTSPSPLLI